MKKILLIVFLCITCFSMYAQSGKFVINGQIKGTYNANKVYLVKEEFINGPQTVIDSSMVVDGKYKFEGKVPEIIKMYFVKSADTNSRTSLTPVFLEEGKINIDVTGEQFTHGARIMGTVNNEILTHYFKEVDHISDSIGIATNIEWKVNGWSNEKEQTEFPRRTNLIEKRWLDIQRQMATLYKNQVFAPFIIYWEMRRDLKSDELRALRDMLDPKLANHPYTLALNDYIASTDFKIGNPMPDFTLPDNNGKMIKWKEFAGKYVLIDFWASWCGPCLRELPNVIKLYNECKGQNFEVVGISLDNDKNKWLNAIKTHKMAWPQLCDFKVWDTQPAKLCNVDAVPFTILVNPKGEVVALNLRGEDLTKKIKELIGNKK